MYIIFLVRYTAILKQIEYGLYEEYTMVHSKIILYLLQDDHKHFQGSFNP